jgi:hypothetical protein
MMILRSVSNHRQFQSEERQMFLRLGAHGANVIGSVFKREQESASVKENVAV